MAKGSVEALPVPSKTPPARSPAETREKRRPKRTIDVSICLTEFPHGLQEFRPSCTSLENERLRDTRNSPLIGYTRVSKADGSQVLDLQRDALIAAGVAERHMCTAHGVRHGQA